MLDTARNRPDLPPEIARRRTFAIISHPDAGKTTLTEKFLLFGGAIQMAGQVRAKGEARRTRSDFMAMEKDRGISVSASAMSFDFKQYRFNLVDTPGHSDFSEDTYRTLTAVDAAVMVIDGAKGVESQTQKLFEVCRMRDLPILTFCNKMDRESRDVFEIIDEIQENLAIDVTPASWPIGVGRDFIGSYDMLHDRLELMERADRNKRAESIKIKGLDDPKLAEHVPAALLEKLREDVEMARELLPALDPKAVISASQPRPLDHSRAAACFEIGRHLHDGGDEQAAITYWKQAHELFPDNWTYKRQACSLVGNEAADNSERGRLMQFGVDDSWPFEGDFNRDTAAIAPGTYYPKTIDH